MSNYLTIAEVADETGVNPATLRAWERRYGFPRPLRPSGGHRRYLPADVEAVGAVIAERAAGATLPAAIARALQAPPARHSGSLFAGLDGGARLPEARDVSKPTMVALSHAVEEECAARAERGILIGAFQERRFFDEAASRWRALARGARAAAVFADFGRAVRAQNGPAKVPIAPRTPLEREWAIVHLAPRSSVLLLGRELPGPRRPDARRRFALVWSAEPELVRDAIEAACAIAEETAPAVAADVRAELDGLPRPLGLDPRFVTALTNRMIGYLDGSTPRR
jgi:DICT domain-containing protein